MPNRNALILQSLLLSCCVSLLFGQNIFAQQCEKMPGQGQIFDIRYADSTEFIQGIGHDDATPGLFTKKPFKWKLTTSNPPGTSSWWTIERIDGGTTPSGWYIAAIDQTAVRFLKSPSPGFPASASEWAFWPAAPPARGFVLQNRWTGKYLHAVHVSGGTPEGYDLLDQLDYWDPGQFYKFCQ